MKSKYLSLLLIIMASAMALSNCAKKEGAENQSNTDIISTSTASEEIQSPQFSVDPVFQRQLGEVFIAYIMLKNAYVASDASKVNKAAVAMGFMLPTVDKNLLTGAAQNDWLNYRSMLESTLKEIENSKGIEEQRKKFNILSDHLYKTIKAFGLGGATAYYEYCPMAFNDQGAYWLSDQKLIRNPYFGNLMLTCGVVKETLK